MSGDYSALITTTAKKLHGRADSSMATPMKMRSNSTLSQTASAVIGLDGAASAAKFDSRNPYRSNKSTTNRQLYEDQSASVLDNSALTDMPLVNLRKQKFGIEGY